MRKMRETETNNERKPVIEKISEDRLRKMYETMTSREIAVSVGLGASTIKRMIHRFGIVPRRAVSRNPRGENNPRWSGDNATYSGIHQRISRYRGKPKHCEVCGRNDPNRMYHWAHVSGSRHNLYNYKRMCVPCHRRHDGNLPHIMKLKSKKYDNKNTVVSNV